MQVASSEEAQAQRVRKMLVVGLGSTGVTICEMLAERLREQFGSLRRTPWIRFLGIETDRSRADAGSWELPVVPITIDQEAFKAARLNPAPLQAAIAWQDWTSDDVLGNIENITSGAGNVRMAGRLAFLYPHNYNTLQVRFGEILSDLNKLSERDAAEERGQLRDGSNPPIRFAGEKDASAITIAVVGSLCGGTASGMAVDWGYFLRLNAPNCSTIAFFTLPRPDLAPAVVPAAQELKGNAFSALRELSHFCQIKRNPYTVKYPDGLDAKTIKEQSPYDFIMLAWPTEGTADGEAPLNRAIAERLFVNSLVDSADPFAAGVNAQAREEYEVDGVIYHSPFCTFGVSTMEYPADRIADACAKRLIQHALDKWCTQQPQDPAIKSELSQLGITWDGLRQQIVSTAGNVDQDLSRLARNVAASTANDPVRWQQEFGKVKAAFGDAASHADPSLPQGSVPKRLAEAQQDAAKAICARLEEHLRRVVPDLLKGPNTALALLDAVQRTLSDIRSRAAQRTDREGEVERVALAMAGFADDIWVRLAGLAGRARRDMQRELARVIDAYAKDRLDVEIAKALSSHRGIDGKMQPGVVDAVLERTATLTRRMLNLRDRAKLYAEFVGAEAEAAKTPPTINGVMLMGTEDVEEWYAKCLATPPEPEAVAKAEENACIDLLKGWTELPRELLAEEGRSFFDRDTPTGRPTEVGRRALRDGDQSTLLSRARAHFSRVLNQDVISRWSASPEAPQQVRTLIDKSGCFIAANSEAVLQLRKRPLDEQRIVAYPGCSKKTEASSEFARELSACAAEFKEADSASDSLVVVVRDQYCVPLQALAGVLQESGAHNTLEEALTKSWRRRSRIDVKGWEPISRKEREHLQKCEQFLGLAVMAGIAEVRNRRLCIKRETDQVGALQYYELPNSLEDAARLWALEEHDLGRQELDELEQILQLRLSKLESSYGPDGFVGFMREGITRRGAGLQGWSPDRAANILERYCRDNERLEMAYLTPNADLKRVLWYEVGQVTVRGIPVIAAGYYCINMADNCDALIGGTEADAAAHKWKCETCGQEYSGSAQVPAEWIKQASRKKGGSTSASTNAPTAGATPEEGR